MRKFLPSILLVGAFIIIAIGNSLFAQNVMSHTDINYQYDSTAPVGSNTNPAVPSTDVLAKWVFDTTQYRYSWWPSSAWWDFKRFKCYVYNGTSFRLRFPKNYDPNSNTKYPLMLSMHGLGECAQEKLWITDPNGTNGRYVYPNSPANRDNTWQLLWGANNFDQRIESGEWNGFLLYPQLPWYESGGWNDNTFNRINHILDTLKKYNHFDEDRLIVFGLSAGGGGNLDYASRYPKRVAAVLPAVPAIGPTDPAAMLHIPTWIGNGGQDPRPKPNQVNTFLNQLGDAGGDVYQSYYATRDHFSWFEMWYQTDINNKFIMTDYCEKAHKAQPLVYFQKTKFCADEPVSSKMGLTPGFYAYEWQKNTSGSFVTIPSATTNEYTATEIGAYRVRFMRSQNDPWSEWTPNPIVLSIKPCSTDTLFVEHFQHYGAAPAYLYNGPSWGYKNYNYYRQSGLFTSGSETFSQDASGRQGGRFLFNHTYPSSATGSTPDTTTPYAVADIVWQNYDGVAVQPNTNYIFSFSLGNITTIAPMVQIVPKINGTVLTPTNLAPNGSGNSSWTKYNYIWNSGSSNTAYLVLENNSVVTDLAGYTNGNDFAVDEIAFTKLLSPGGVTGMALWAKPENVIGTPSTGITSWINAAGNKNLMTTKTNANKPSLSSDGADNINFNTVATFIKSEADSLTAYAGFSGNTLHTAAHAYVVAIANNSANNHFFFQENQSASNKIELALPNNGLVSFTAGGATNVVETPFVAADINKPLLWSFSKNDAGTPTNNTKTQDIRKNGLVIAATNTVGNFTGNASTFQLGEFDGKVAEVVYYLDKNIDAAAQNKIESYLALKYGLTLGSPTNLQNYTASNGNLFWTANATYQQDVFGIGKDNLSGINQAISNSMNTGSGTGIGQSGKGNIVVQTITPLADYQFLMMGNDAGSFAEQTSDIPATAIGAKRIGREWKVNNTGTVGAVNISFDLNGITIAADPTDINNFILLIDNDGDGDFTTGSLTTKKATAIDGQKILFNNTTLANNVVFTLITAAPVNGSLPATWLSFTVQAKGSTAVLNWKTTDELNVQSYVVEHSTDGTSFTAIQTLAALNETGINNYDFEHVSLPDGVHYYRIKRVDNNSSVGYTAIKSIKIPQQDAVVQIKPNPVTGKTLFLEIASVQKTRAAISIISAEGKTLLLQSKDVDAGTNRIAINLGVLPDGVYLLRVQLGDKFITQKFTKTH
jgi:pimeloyl-ACP methyl ester carboxylesterase